MLFTLLFSGCQKADDKALELYNIITARSEKRDLTMVDKLKDLVGKYPATPVSRKAIRNIADIYYAEKSYPEALEYILQIDRAGFKPEETALYDHQKAVSEYNIDKNNPEARTFFEKVVADLANYSPEIQFEAKKHLGDMQYKELFSNPPEDRIIHTVERGENFYTISKKYNTSPEFLMKLNKIKNAQSLSIGQRLTVLKQAFDIKINIKTNLMVVNRNGSFFKQYQIATGRMDATPLGKFYISIKQKNPTWFWDGKKIPPGDPENALGTRWLGIENKDRTTGGHYGIHGTNDPESIGQNASHGCIRMHNKEVEELFDMVSLETRVKIFD